MARISENLSGLATAMLLLATSSTLSSVAAQEQATSVCTGTGLDGTEFFNGGNEYMCVDWSVGSAKMEAAENDYRGRTGESAVFGMGSYGLQADGNIGKCYKFDITTDGGSTATKVIGQVTNFGGDIEAGQFDMQMGGGGFGIWNACSYGTFHVDVSNSCVSNIENQSPSIITYMNVESLFDSVSSQWGENCEGQIYRSGCPWLPTKPRYGSLPAGEPDLRELCEKSYDKGVRKNNGNPDITGGERITCPEELVGITDIRRNDDNTFSQDNMGSGQLTSTMDCCAPAGSNSVNIPTGSSGPSSRLVPCKNDGYTRSTFNE